MFTYRQAFCIQKYLVAKAVSWALRQLLAREQSSIVGLRATIILNGHHRFKTHQTSGTDATVLPVRKPDAQDFHISLSASS